MGLRVLVVDDDELNRKLVQRVLALRGFEVELVENGISALAAVERQRPDLIVLDLMMPGVSGADVLEQIKSNPRMTTIPVIMLTARTGDDDLIASYRSGADYYITKPLKADELLYGVSLVLGRDAVPPLPDVTPPTRPARTSR